MLGLVATGKRSIRSGAEYAKYFNSQVKGKEVLLLSDGDVYDTLSLMKDIVRDTLPQTKPISQVLKASSLEETCKNIFEFLYHHVQYKKDNPMREQLRTPARTWRDRAKGVDCDCYSIFISSVLTNLRVPHSFRMAGYKGDFQHVYVVVPKSGSYDKRSDYYVIDAVVSKFNHEVPFNKKHDNKMAGVTMLNGAEGGKCQAEPIKLRTFISTQSVFNAGLIPALYFFEKHKIPYTPVFDKEKNQSAYEVITPLGKKIVPTVFNSGYGQELLTTLSMPAPAAVATLPTTPAIPQATQASIPWWLLLAVGGGLLFMSDDQKPKPPTPVNGLNGPVKKKKYKTMTL